MEQLLRIGIYILAAYGLSNFINVPVINEIVAKLISATATIGC